MGECFIGCGGIDAPAGVKGWGSLAAANMFAVIYRNLHRKGHSLLFYPVENLVDNLSFQTDFYFDKFVHIRLFGLQT